MPPSTLTPDTILHATAVAAGDRGLLILGPSGAGKSTLALALIALGARLIADDRTELRRNAQGMLRLSAPHTIAGQIEARGVGILRLPYGPATATLACDLSRTETRRLPEPREIVIEGVPLPCLGRVDHPAFPSMLWLRLSSEPAP